MIQRFALYFAPARDSEFWRLGRAWLAQPSLAALTVSARRYDFHATLKAPMALVTAVAELEAALAAFAAEEAPVALPGLAPRLIGGFLALTTEPQPAPLTAFAGRVVKAFEPLRAPPTAQETARRQAQNLTRRQAELLALYGYPYVLDQFQFHMTLTDRLSDDEAPPLLAAARDWFAPILADPVTLDRVVVFEEPEPGAPFDRRAPDYPLGAFQRIGGHHLSGSGTRQNKT